MLGGYLAFFIVLSLRAVFSRSIKRGGVGVVGMGYCVFFYLYCLYFSFILFK